MAAAARVENRLFIRLLKLLSNPAGSGKQGSRPLSNIKSAKNKNAACHGFIMDMIARIKTT